MKQGSIYCLVAKMILTVIAAEAYGYIGLAIASSLSYSIGAALLLAFAGSKLARIDAGAILLYVVKVLAATAVGFLAAHLIYGWFVADGYDFVHLLVTLPPAIILSLLIVAIIGYVLNISDIRALPGMVRKRQRSDVDKN